VELQQESQERAVALVLGQAIGAEALQALRRLGGRQPVRLGGKPVQHRRGIGCVVLHVGHGSLWVVIHRTS